MGRQMLNRDTRLITCNILKRIFSRSLEAQARLGYRTYTDYVEYALEKTNDDILGGEIALAPGPRPNKISLALSNEDIPVEDPPVITALVPEKEAIAAVDQPRPFDPAKDDVMDYIKGKRS